MVLSALVCPGAGQFVQRRWFAGLLFMLAFAASFIVFAVVAVELIASYYRMAFEFETYEPPEIRPGRLLFPFAVAIGIYVVNLVDVALARFRTCRKGTAGDSVG